MAAEPNDWSENEGGKFPLSAGDALVALASLSAPFLGGGDTFLAIGLLLSALGVTGLAFAPKVTPPRLFVVCLIVLAGLFFITLLPHKLVGRPDWIANFESSTGAPLSVTSSAQPFLTLENAILGACGLAVAWQMVTRPTVLRKRTLVSIFAGSALLLALVSFVLYKLNYTGPLWQSFNGKFGPFQNRNHTGTMLAMGGVSCLALAYECMGKQRGQAFFWLIGYFLIGAGLVMNASRGGLLLFFLGSICWLTWVSLVRRDWVGLAKWASVFLLIATCFLAYKGATLQRFLKMRDAGGTEQAGFRLRIQKDALPLLRDASWRGVGLGNFDGYFSGYRRSSVAQNHVSHPEGDWLWLGVEAGWFAPLLLAAALGAVLVRNFPRPEDPQFLPRSAAFACVLMVAFHGLFDVPGHTFGVALPGVFLLMVLRRSDERPGVSPGARKLSKAVSAAVLTCGLYCLAASASTRVPMPSLIRSRAVDQVENPANEAFKSKVYQAATKGLEVAPLWWGFYFNRAVAEAWLFSDPSSAVSDFKRCYYLEPNYARLPLAEGEVWTLHSSKLALDAWRRALQRAPEQDDGGAGVTKAALFQRMMTIATELPELRLGLAELAADDPARLLVFFQHAAPAELQAILDRHLARDPRLSRWSSAQLASLFSLWQKKGDLKSLQQALQGDSGWNELAWVARARMHAGRGEYREAYELAASKAVAPSLPTVLREGGEADLARSALDPTDYASGYALYLVYLRANRTNEAARIVRRFTANRDCPKYFHFLESELTAANKDYRTAWASLERYLEAP